MSARKVVVIGAGIGGLTAAYQLCKAGVEVVVVDSVDYFGGRTKAVEKQGFTLNVGAGLLPGSYTDTIALAKEVGLSGEISHVNGKCGFIRQGQVYPIDLGSMMTDMLTTGLIDWRSKLRLINLLPPMLRHYKNLSYHNLGLAADLDDRTVSEFCLQSLDKPLHDYLFGPFIRTMYLQSPESASLAQLLWCMKNLSGAPFGFSSGMDALGKKLATKLDVRLKTEVTQLQESGDGVRLSVRTADGVQQQLEADACIIATDTAALENLYGYGLTARQQQFIDNLEYCADVVVTFCLNGMPETQMTLLQIPEEEDPELAVLQIYRENGDGRAPVGKSMVSMHFLDSWSKSMMDASDEVVIADAKARASKFIPEVASKLELVHVERWPRAATKSHVGIYKDLARFMEDINPESRVQYCGDYMSLSSVNTAVVTGKMSASRTLDALA